MKNPSDLLRFTYPGVVAVITVETQGKRNVMAAGWHMAVSFEPPLWAVAVGHQRYTYTLLQKASGFVIQFFPIRHADWVVQVGRTSGREVDKIKRFRLPVAPARTVEGFWIRGAYAVMECVPYAQYPAGDHDIVVGEIVDGWYSPQGVDEDGVLRLDVLKPALYLGRNTFWDLETGRRLNPIARGDRTGG